MVGAARSHPHPRRPELESRFLFSIAIIKNRLPRQTQILPKTMPAEPTVLRRYTPPTCTLEIAAKQSPLSRWMGKLALKDLKFKLSLDDPRVTDQDWVVLRGDKSQLEALTQVVGNYVQGFLSQSQSASAGIQSSGLKSSGLKSSGLKSRGLESTGSQLFSTDFSNDTVAIAPVSTPTCGINLSPFGLLSHQLKLGELATEQSGETLTLSSTQLADLASALDDYNAEATALPQLTRPSLKAMNWGAIAAGGLLTLGVGASVLQGFDRNQRSEPQQASSNDQRIALQPSPPPSPTPSSVLTPLPLPLGGLKPGVPGAPPTVPIVTAPGASTTDTSGSTSTSSTGGSSTGGSSTGDASTSTPAPITIQPKQDQPQEIKPLPGSTKNTAPAAKTVDTNELPPAQGLPKLSTSSAPVAPITGNSRMEGSAARQSTAASPVKDSTLFETNNPQIAEVRQFFQSRWKAPASLKESVEYRLKIAPNGSVEQIEPIGNEAGRVLGDTNVPLEGDAFVSANPEGRSTAVRVLFGPDNSVQVFPESQ